MKLCPYCGKELVPNALACKHCGEWLADISDYLKKRGSIYAVTNSMVINSGTPKKAEEKKANCAFCECQKVLTENESEEKKFICPECGKKNLVTGRYVEEILRNIPIGWGWLLLTLYFAFSIHKYLDTLEDDLRVIITFAVSLSVMLLIYFSTRWYLLKLRYIKRRKLDKIYDVSAISGIVSTIGVIAFVFAFHFVYPYTGLESDKKETDIRLNHFRSKIEELSDKQKNISDLISSPTYNKKDSDKNSNLLDEYIKLNKDEKLYIDSIYKTFEDSEYYSEKLTDKRKIKDANLLVNKIIVYKIMSAHNLKHFYRTGDNKALKAVEELNSEIAKLNNEYTSKFGELFSVD